VKITNEQIKQIIKEELNQVLKEANLKPIFSPADGSVDKETITQYFIKAEQGDKESAEALWHAAPMLVKKGHNFSPADGTPMKRDAIAKAYGLDSNKLSSIYNKAPSNNKPAVGNKNTERNSQMIKLIQTRINRLDPTKDAEKISRLKKSMETFK
tara:strand:- start:1242 stop:1706 length:465 start_codon:yes stop_codon:yes gene_type:complete